MQSLQKRKENPFGSSRIVLFGYDTFSAAQNMAIDEILKERADKEDRFFIRFYDVAKPSVILGSGDHYDVIKSGSADGCDVSRRMTGGRPIYLDRNTLQYSIAGPLHGSVDPFPREMHKRFGSILADAIAGLIGGSHEISMPRSSSIRIDGKPIAGHGQSISPNRSFLYHGVVVIRPWDLSMIDALLHVDRKDFTELGTLPNLHDLRGTKRTAVDKEDLISAMMARLPVGQLEVIGTAEREAILESSTLLSAEKYANARWVFRDDIQLRRDTRFCILYEGELTQGD